MANIEQYTNEELQTSLREYGMNVPVTPTTRKVCENKLRKLIAQSGGQQTVIPKIKDHDSPDNFSRYDQDRESTPQLPEDSFVSLVLSLCLKIIRLVKRKDNILFNNILNIFSPLMMFKDRNTVNFIN